MKKKIVCYGNCHLSVIGQWLHKHYSDLFEVVDCTEVGLQGFWGTKNFAVWSPENSPNQSLLHERIIHKINQCDVFLFQHMEHKAIPELQTQQLYSNLPKNTLAVCLPNSRFFAYPACKITFPPFIHYIHNTITQDIDEIFNYFLTQNDPKFKEILDNQYSHTISGNNSTHNTNSQRYKNIIEINKFIEQNWTKHLLFATCSHPIGQYWSHLITQLTQFINIPLDENTTQNINYPQKDGIINIHQISFIQNLLPNILIPKEITTLLPIEKKHILHAINTIQPHEKI